MNEAIRLLKAAMKTAATDQVTGEIDMDLLVTGQSARSRRDLDRLRASVMDLLDKLVKAGGKGQRDFMSSGDLFRMFCQQSQQRVDENRFSPVLMECVEQSGLNFKNGLVYFNRSE